MKKSITFIGEAGGDCECFCWYVDAETYIDIIGRERFERELWFDKEFAADMGREFNEELYRSGRFRVYPDLFFSDDNKQGDRKRKFTIIVEEIGQEDDK